MNEQEVLTMLSELLEGCRGTITETSDGSWSWDYEYIDYDKLSDNIQARLREAQDERTKR